jgi:hypothetical protein
MRNQTIGIILSIVVGIVGYNYFVGPRVVTVTEYKTEQIDENLWVSRGRYLSQRDLAQRLLSDSTQLAQELQRTKREILTSTEIISKLRLERDSLKNRPTSIDLTGIPIDTSLVYLYGDSLLAVTAIIKLDSVRLYHDIDIEQLRPLDIQVTTTRDVEGLYVYVESRDLEIVAINTFTAIDKPKYKWYHYVGGGFIGGVILWELIR